MMTFPGKSTANERRGRAVSRDGAAVQGPASGNGWWFARERASEREGARERQTESYIYREREIKRQSEREREREKEKAK